MTEVIKLVNGIVIVLEKISFVRSIALGIWVENGSKHESETMKGMSHFIEHMMFKGTTNRSAKMIADDMDEIGGQINAYTSREYTCYHTRTLDTHFDRALDVLSDMILNSKFDENELDKERNVIIEEINMYEDSPEEQVHDLLSENVFLENSLGYPILGTKDTLNSFDSNIMKKYLKEHYTPNNMVISIAGNFDKDHAINELEKRFSGFRNDAPDLNFELSPKYHTCNVKKEKDIEQVHMCIGFPGVKTGDKEVYTLAILDTIFGGGMSSRLFQKIREEKGLAYSTYSYPSNYKEIGIYKIYSSMSANQVPEVYSLILQEIKGLKTNPITEDQLAKTKEQLKSSYIISLESTINRMMAIGRTQLILNKVQTPDELINKIDSVSLSDVNLLIDQIFKESQMSVAMVGKVAGLAV